MNRSYSYDEYFHIKDMMLKYGGSFVKSLGNCLAQADFKNRVKLKNTFPEYFYEYFNYEKFNKTEE